ncbi:hypothetical protein [Mycolicibacterium vanbaalenii]|uniref:hypothetical protein n=1 Tax=Mycolicibacterium vanbaalenii TaxID=110539 RepID=UPI003CC7E993
MTTVEKIVNSTPLLADSPAAIRIASSTFHARRARRILGDESPALAARLIRARDYLPMEYGLLHAGLVAFEGYRERRARSVRRQHPRCETRFDCARFSTSETGLGWVQPKERSLQRSLAVASALREGLKLRDCCDGLGA